MSAQTQAPAWFKTKAGTIRRGQPHSQIPHAPLTKLGPEHVQPGHSVRFMSSAGDGLYEGMVQHVGELGATVKTDDGSVHFTPYHALHDVMPPGTMAYGPHHMTPGASVTLEKGGTTRRGSVLAWGHAGAICEIEGKQERVPYDAITHVGSDVDLDDPTRDLSQEPSTRAMAAARAQGRALAMVPMRKSLTQTVADAMVFSVEETGHGLAKAQVHPYSKRSGVFVSGYSQRRPAGQVGLTAAQQKAHDESYAASDHTVEGNFSRGDIVADRQGQTWKVATYGIRYHSDVSARLYGVQPAKGPKGFAETQELRRAVEHVLTTGTHEPGSRGGREGEMAERPAGQQIASWTDSRPGSLAAFPTVTVYENGVVGVVRPRYDDSPSVAWARDDKLAHRLAKLIAAYPHPVHLPEANVKERTTRLDVQATHPRYSAYSAARGAQPYEGGIALPKSEHRRIKAELDAAGVENP